MRAAIGKAREGVAAGQTPFGCAIARDGQVIAAAHNCVLATVDITAHAEINALREGCREVGGIFLEGAIVATTCEPCPMCMAALHWARVEEVYYGATIADAAASGFNELTLSAAELLRQGRSPVRLIDGILRDECRDLFDEWRQLPHARAY
ncbi:MAG: nucleoside deaminase [Planctomycetes bacterium]|nr:nucleoside deaminase [Planctomycetota bacterium]